MTEEIDYKALYEAEQKKNEELHQKLNFMHERYDAQTNKETNRLEFNARLNCLKAMETLVRNINNEEFIGDWLMNGFPDEGTEEDYREIAYNPDLYMGAVDSFLRTMQRSMDSYDYFVYSHYGKTNDRFGQVVDNKPYKEDIYGHKTSADKFNIQVNAPYDNAIYRLKEEDFDKVVELLNTFVEVGRKLPTTEQAMDKSEEEQ